MKPNLIEGRLLEAVLFAAAMPLPIDTLAEIFDCEPAELEESLALYGKELEEQERGIRLHQTGAGAELVSAPECSTYVEKIREKEATLSRAAMETLAVVAFKQPVTRAEIEELRGVNSERVLKQLLEKELIVELGRRDSVGRPVLYGTTDHFLRSLGISSLDSLRGELMLPDTLAAEEKQEDDFGQMAAAGHEEGDE